MPGLFAQVILPLSLHDTYTYKIPENLNGKIKPGQRVVVQFGSRKLYSALVISLTEAPPKKMEFKEIMQVLDDKPVVLPQNLTLWQWMAEYYCCTLGDIYRAAMPPGLKLESRSKVFLTGNDKEIDISGKEQLIIDELNQGLSSLESLQNNLGNNFSYKALKILLDKGLIQVEETISRKYKPRTLTFIGLDQNIQTEEQLNNTIETLKRAKKQQELLLHFCDKINVFGTDRKTSVSKKELLKGTGFSNAILNQLIKKKILVAFKKAISRISDSEDRQFNISLLNDFQENAIEKIKSGFDQNKVVLIHGIAASGKTELYIHLIRDIMRSGRQVLYLLPEIALTSQIINRLKNVFGRKAGIYHSRLNSQERVEIWNKILMYGTEPESGYQIILGTRSSVFIPFSDLGLIIVDEEHENSFKQHDPAPRYNARDTAVMLGIQNKARVLLGSATPSYESYYNALTGKYELVNLEKRYSNTELPEIIVSDIKRACKKKQMLSVLTPELFSTMNRALENKEQVILFQNRRGYSPFVQCFICGWIPKCKYCDVSLTYHKYNKKLICHYCGFRIDLPDRCQSCGSPEIKTRGFGTEKIDDELRCLFPDRRIERIDYDTTRSKNAFSKIIQNAESGQTDILIGTQMITKGFDFEHVSVAGILNADNLVDFPDFRAHERAFQLISQVSGRAGRKHNRGKVIIQTSQPEHPLIDLIRKQNYRSAFNVEMEERKLFKYPPYYRLIKLIVRHKKINTVNRVASQLADRLREQSSLIVLGPEFPLVGRIQMMYIKEIWLKIKKKQHLSDIKKMIINIVTDVRKIRENSSCVIIIDVDPY